MSRIDAARAADAAWLAPVTRDWLARQEGRAPLLDHAVSNKAEATKRAMRNSVSKECVTEEVRVEEGAGGTTLDALLDEADANRPTPTGRRQPADAKRPTPLALVDLAWLTLDEVAAVAPRPVDAFRTAAQALRDEAPATAIAVLRRLWRHVRTTDRMGETTTAVLQDLLSLWRRMLLPEGTKSHQGDLRIARAAIEAKAAVEGWHPAKLAFAYAALAMETRAADREAEGLELVALGHKVLGPSSADLQDMLQLLAAHLHLNLAVN